MHSNEPSRFGRVFNDHAQVVRNAAALRLSGSYECRSRTAVMSRGTWLAHQSPPPCISGR